MKLYTYWRSSAAYRVRIGLGLKELAYEARTIDLVREGGEQLGTEFRAVNPNALVPALELDDGRVLTQSLAILEYLDELQPTPPLLPADRIERARVRAAAQLIACDVHPVNNLRVTTYLKTELGHDQDDVVRWMRHWMSLGLEALTATIAPSERFCFGDTPTLADLCLVPQLYNARRWGLELKGLGRLVAIEEACLAMQAFAQATPEAQPDAVPPPGARRQ